MCFVWVLRVMQIEVTNLRERENGGGHGLDRRRSLRTVGIWSVAMTHSDKVPYWRTVTVLRIISQEQPALREAHRVKLSSSATTPHLKR